MMLAGQIAIGFGFAVIFPLLVYYGAATFYPPPNRADSFAEFSVAGAIRERRGAQRILRQKDGERLQCCRQDLFARPCPRRHATRCRRHLHRSVFEYPRHRHRADLGRHSVRRIWVLRILAIARQLGAICSLLAGFAILLFVGWRRIAGTSITSASQ